MLMFIYLLTVIIILPDFECIEFITAECDYDFYNNNVLGQLYYCEVVNQLEITSNDLNMMNASNGKHKDGQSNNDVTFLFTSNKIVHFFPEGLGEIFKNLKLISFDNCHMKELNEDDLKPFPNLYDLSLYSNDIDVLKGNIFSNNLNLAIVDFRFNKLVHIGENTFKSLTKLTYLFFKGNPCTTIDVENNSTAVNEMLKHARLNCTVKDVLGLNELENEFNLLKPGHNFEFKFKLGKFKENFNNLTIFYVKKKIQKFDNFREHAELNAYKSQTKIDKMPFEKIWMLIIMAIAGLVHLIILLFGDIS
ncbi:hypothetical protein ACKWTF_015417 [Chironomus riparius]